jgi:NAD(P)-dependent dehydrogenase (short-subunit alcohol dehydrogenase family)
MTTLVTGGTRGIGREICRILPHAEGIGRAECDLSSLRSVDAYLPPRDARTLVICAGVMGITHFLEDQVTDDGFDRCWQINFLSQSRLLLRMPWVRHVVYVSSGAVHGVRACNLASRFACHSRLLSYAASKAAMHGFLRAWSADGEGRTYVCVDPGDVDTEIMHPVEHASGLLALIKRVLRRRRKLISPAAAARAVLAQQPMREPDISDAESAGLFMWAQRPRCYSSLNGDRVICALITIVTLVIILVTGMVVLHRIRSGGTLEPH